MIYMPLGINEVRSGLVWSGIKCKLYIVCYVIHCIMVMTGIGLRVRWFEASLFSVEEIRSYDSVVLLGILYELNVDIFSLGNAVCSEYSSVTKAKEEKEKGFQIIYVHLYCDDYSRSIIPRLEFLERYQQRCDYFLVFC